MRFNMEQSKIYIKDNPISWSSLPERSEWVCYMFGASKDEGIRYNPAKGQEPNWFVRTMMKICFACTWVKETK